MSLTTINLNLVQIGKFCLTNGFLFIQKQQFRKTQCTYHLIYGRDQSLKIAFIQLFN